jgi:hypothetical protein
VECFDALGLTLVPCLDIATWDYDFVFRLCIANCKSFAQRRVSIDVFLYLHLLVLNDLVCRRRGLIKEFRCIRNWRRDGRSLKNNICSIVSSRYRLQL